MKRSQWLIGKIPKRTFCPQCNILGAKCSCEADYYAQIQEDESLREQEIQERQREERFEMERSYYEDR